MLKTFRLAMTLLWREWRAGEWLVVFFALFLAVSAITGFHFCIDRLMRGLDQQSAKFLGGDLVVSSPNAFPKKWELYARSLSLRTAEVWSYPSVVSASHKLQLVNIQAVSDAYPLIDHKDSPQKNSIWVEPRLLPLLGLQLHGKITIGAFEFSVNKIISGEEDSLSTGLIIAPRVMMNIADVPLTKTVIAGSRVDYRLLIVGNKNQLLKFRQWITPQLQPGQRLLDVRNQRFMLQKILERTENYLQLILLVCLMMSAVAIVLSVQQYMRRHFSHVALWRCLGAMQSQIIQIFIWQLLVIAFTAGCIGVAVGYVTQEILLELFKNFLQFSLPAASMQPVFLGFVTSTILLFAFSYPVLTQLPKTSPLFIWRNEIKPRSLANNLYPIVAILIIFSFLFWLTDFSMLVLFFLDALLLSVGLLYAVSLFLLYCSRKLLPYTEGVFRRGLSQLLQYSDSVSIQFVGFTLVLTFLLVLRLVQQDILQSWQQSLPKNTPNYFAFNIAPSDVTGMKDLFHQQQVTIEGIYPMVRGRMIELNDKPILSVIPESGRQHNALHRELNLSWMWNFPSDNKIVSGVMWSRQDNQSNVISVEKNLAEDLNLHLGDKLTFQIGEQKVSAYIANFRSLDWQSFHPNFFVIFKPGLLDNIPATYIASFYLNPNQAGLINHIVEQFPNVTVIDVVSLLKQIQELISKISLALQYLFLFSLAMGVLILITSLQASMDERRQTYHLLHVLGASRTFILKSLVVEFFVLALFIGFSSLVLAYLIQLIILSM